MSYQIPQNDYSLGDIERFVALSIRRGASLASLKKTSKDDVRVVLGAFLLNEIKTGSQEKWIEEAEKFLSGVGSWLNDSSEALFFEAISLELLVREGDNSLTNQLYPLPEVSKYRLIDECELAQDILSRRRAEVRLARETKNRLVNAPKAPEVDPKDDEKWMSLALEEAREAAMAGEVPVGAVLVEEGKLLARGQNRTLRDQDPSAHAEMVALREATRVAKNHRLTQTTLYVTLEPCPMCAGAILQARCQRVVFGASDEKMGAIGGAFNLFEIPGMNHHPFVKSQVLSSESKAILQAFFKSKRQGDSSSKCLA